MNYSTLISTIRSVITRNGTNAITGDTLQEVLVSIVQSIGKYCTFKGVATPSTNPSNIDQNVFYLTSTPGTYANFGGLVVPQGKLVALLYNNNRWTQIVIMTLQGGGVINIDPALDPNSVNPVENREITRVCTGLDNRITTLENAAGAKLYQKDVYFKVTNPNWAGLFTISFLATDNHRITAVAQLAGMSFFIKQSRMWFAADENAWAYYISFLAGGGARIETMTQIDPYYSTWNVESNDDILIISGRVIDIIV